MANDPGNAIIAHTLHWLAVLLEIDDGDTKRVEAYRQAAYAVRKLDEPLKGIVKRGGAKGLERIGFSGELAITVADWVRTGEMPPLVPQKKAFVPLWPALTRALCRTLGIPRSRRPARPSAPRGQAWESWH